MAQAAPDRAEMQVDDDQSSSDDSDDSMDLGATNEADMNAMMQLEGQLQANPYVYDTHVQVCMASDPCCAQQHSVIHSN